MQAYIVWFVAAAVLVAAELLSGTFYLLVIGVGVAAGGLTAIAGWGFGAQLGVASVVSVAGIALLRMMRIGVQPRGTQSNIAFDAGQAVEVIERHADGSLRVNYRGTQWDAKIEGPPGDHLVIKETRGNTLILTAQA